MDTQAHLLVCISGHGFGHVAQTAPVLNALHALLPELRISIRTAVPLPHLRTRLRFPFGYIRETHGDLGMAMKSALDVNVTESAAMYQTLHRDWGLAVSNEARLLREIAPDFVLTNVGYLPLAGAYRAGIPCAAMSSLHWGDIFQHYCDRLSGTRQVTEQILNAYAHADAFLRLTPGMPMSTLPNRLEIGPVADIGTDRRQQLNDFFGLNSSEKVVLVSLGGFDSRLPVERWPRIPGVRWLVPASWRAAHPDALNLEAPEIGFSDLLVSCDALICKPGYGSFVEAACAGTPLLYASRDDWPETPYLNAWLQENATAREVARTALENGDIAAALAELWAEPARTPVTPNGNQQAADWLAARISG